MRSLKSTCIWLAYMLVALCLAPVQAQGWQPSRVVEFTSPGGPGAAFDAAARELARLLQDVGKVSQTIVVQNKPGGGGTLAMATLTPHPGDGHRLTTFGTAMLNVRAIGGASVSYADLTPIAIYLEEAIVVGVRADSPLKTAGDLVAKLKAEPSSLSIGIADAVGNHIHVAIAKPLKTAGVEIERLTIVPYKSSAETMTALLGGHIDVISASTPNVIGQHQAGNIRLLAVGTENRLTGPLATVPTWKEQGVNSTYSSVQGLMGPPDMTPEQILFWEGALRRVSESPEWNDFLAKKNWRPKFIEHAKLQDYLDENYASTRALLEDLGVTQR